VPFAITTKLLGYVAGGLGAAALAASAFAGIQTHRLDETRGTVTVLQGNLKRADEAFASVVLVANERAEALKGRDGIIRSQSDSIDALDRAAQADRSSYLAGIRKADAGAKAHEARADELIHMPTPAPADRCEAARALILQEMRNVR